MQPKRFFVNHTNIAEKNSVSLKIKSFMSFEEARKTYKGDGPGIMSREEQAAGFFKGNDIYFISGNVSLYTSFVGH